MTDQEWQEGIERALNAAWQEHGPHPGMESAIVCAMAAYFVNGLPLRITLCHTGKDKLGHFRVGPARDEEA